MNEAYLMDCMEYMKTLPDNAFDLAVVDPPYRDMSENRPTKDMRNNGTMKKFGDKPNMEYFNNLFRISKSQIIWGCNNFQIPTYKGFIVWVKGIPQDFTMSMAEIASLSENLGTISKVVYIRSSGSETKIHPTQKPVALYRWIFKNYAKPGMKILDTHLGSGSSRIAAWDAGLDFVGTEIDETYFRLQEERFKKHIAQGNLFLPQEKVAEQIDLFNVALNEEKQCYSISVDT